MEIGKKYQTTLIIVFFCLNLFWSVSDSVSDVFLNTNIDFCLSFHTYYSLMKRAEDHLLTQKCCQLYNEVILCHIMLLFFLIKCIL